MISRKQLARVIADRMNKKSSKALAKEIAHYLLKEKRTSELAPLMRDIAARRAEKGLIEANAVSAHKLSQDVQRALMKLATAEHKDYQRVILNQDRDPALIGGVRLTAIDRELDLSVKNRLRNLTKSINNAK